MKQNFAWKPTDVGLQGGSKSKPQTFIYVVAKY